MKFKIIFTIISIALLLFLGFFLKKYILPKFNSKNIESISKEVVNSVKNITNSINICDFVKSKKEDNRENTVDNSIEIDRETKKDKFKKSDSLKIINTFEKYVDMKQTLSIFIKAYGNPLRYMLYRSISDTILPIRKDIKCNFKIDISDKKIVVDQFLKKFYEKKFKIDKVRSRKDIDNHIYHFWDCPKDVSKKIKRGIDRRLFSRYMNYNYFLKMNREIVVILEITTEKRDPFEVFLKNPYITANMIKYYIKDGAKWSDKKFSILLSNKNITLDMLKVAINTGAKIEDISELRISLIKNKEIESYLMKVKRESLKK